MTRNCSRSKRNGNIVDISYGNTINREDIQWAQTSLTTCKKNIYDTESTADFTFCSLKTSRSQYKTTDELKLVDVTILDKLLHSPTVSIITP